VSAREARFTSARADRALAVNVANAALRWARRFISLDPDDWVRRAVAAVEGASESDVGFREELRLLCLGIERDSDLHFVGRLSARDDTVRMIRTQLRVRRALAERAERSGGLPELMPALFILGWPRTGTTHLLGLLAEDPAHRSLPYYESFDPVPPPPGREDRRAQKVDKMLGSVRLLSAHYQSIHPMKGDDPEECVALFMNALRSYQFEFQYRLPDYVRYLQQSSPLEAYRFYCDQLRLCQAARPAGERWLLKDPTHLLGFETLIELFPEPGTRFVFTHRDPVAALGSICSLYAHTRAMFSDAVDAQAIGPELMAGIWPDALERALEQRAARPGLVTADLHYAALVRDPLPTLERLYAALDLELRPAARQAMAAYVAAHPQARSGAHRYALEQFGLRAGEVRERFKAYSERYGVEPESGLG
jgi:hypothetical protein